MLIAEHIGESSSSAEHSRVEAEVFTELMGPEHYRRGIDYLKYDNHNNVVHFVKQVRFIVMGNLFYSEYRILRRFDLKGSSHGRTTDKAEAEIDETTTLKDLDLNFVFRLQRHWFTEFIQQIKQDCDILEAERIMDYSLLVLVRLHFRDDVSASKMDLSPYIASPNYCKRIMWYSFILVLIE
ncbi:hypothetical protein COCNU_14G009060 [Cocos nucifera]|uniref:1-phosphatidylinositol-4-phosphate 5-kinase n=1 Tax=Cocos nucifera TaxID=13894 RepID=A0A8K0IVU2_COCNU|nr:hypothetical protein COCNU_14G009060 [Cocos nucifera]